MKSGLINDNAVEKMKTEIRQKINKELDNEEAFNSWLGKYLTMPLRYRNSRPRPFFIKDVVSVGVEEEKKEKNIDLNSEEEGYDDDEYEDEDEFIDPYSIRGPYKVASEKMYESAEDVLKAVLRGNG